MTRISHERLAAGSAFPLIYEFMKREYPDLPLVLETGEERKEADEITSCDIIRAGLQLKDLLCMKVVMKYAEVMAQ